MPNLYPKTKTPLSTNAAHRMGPKNDENEYKLLELSPFSRCIRLQRGYQVKPVA